MALPDLVSSICYLSCPVCDAELPPITHQPPTPLLPFPSVSKGRSPSYKEQENPQISFTKMSWSGSLSQEFEWAWESTRSCLTQLRAASLCHPFVRGDSWGLSSAEWDSRLSHLLLSQVSVCWEMPSSNSPATALISWRLEVTWNRNFKEKGKGRIAFQRKCLKETFEGPYSKVHDLI